MAPASASSCARCGQPPPPGARFCPSCGAQLTRAPRWDAPVPERLAEALGPQYSVVGELGRGGFAIVYSVRDLRLNRYLAVKIMRPDLVESRVIVERFHREAQLVAQLDHPNILPVSFAGEGAGLVYYAMPRVKGETLREHLRQERKLPVALAGHIFAEVGRGLHYAHMNGVLHRDVKPANIMLEHTGRVLLLDFGIAKALSADGGNITTSGLVIGSAEYMSPEQASGQKDLDSRTDVYALGVVAYEMLTGALPFSGDAVRQLLAKQSADAPADVRTARPEVPAPFAEAIGRCLMRDPAARWPTAEAAVRAVT